MRENFCCHETQDTEIFTDPRCNQYDSDFTCTTRPPIY